MNQSSGQNPLISAALLAALCAAIGYIFLLVPNVEMISAAVFISGAVMGPLYGAAIGLVSELVFSLFNPYGSPMPSLLAAQLFSFALIGFCGGWAARLPLRRPWIKMAVYALIGLVLTLLYDVLTTLSFTLLSFGADWRKTWVIFVQGAPFYLLHAVSNFLIFAFIVPYVPARIASFRFLRREIE